MCVCVFVRVQVRKTMQLQLQVNIYMEKLHTEKGRCTKNSWRVVKILTILSLVHWFLLFLEIVALNVLLSRECSSLQFIYNHKKKMKTLNDFRILLLYICMLFYCRFLKLTYQKSKKRNFSSNNFPIKVKLRENDPLTLSRFYLDFINSFQNFKYNLVNVTCVSTILSFKFGNLIKILSN